MDESVKNHWHQPEVDSGSVTAPLSVALKDSSEGHPAGGQDFKLGIDLPLWTTRCLEEWAWHQFTDSSQQNGSIGGSRVGRSVRRRSEEEGCGDLSEDPSVMSFEYLCRSSQSQVRKAIPLCLFSESLYAMNTAGGSNNVAIHGYSFTDFLFAGLICLSPMSGDTSSWQQRPVLSAPLDMEGRNPVTRLLAMIH